MTANGQEGPGSKPAGPRLVRDGGGKRPPEGLSVEVREIGDVPSAIEAVAVEDDTYFVLGADPGFKEPTEHPIRIWTAVHEAEPALPGSLRVHEGRPLRLHAVIHDLSLDPTWKEAWIEAALIATLEAVERRGLRSLALPTLGAIHGRLPLERFLELLAAALGPAHPDCLESLVLLAPEGAGQTLEALLEG